MQDDHDGHSNKSLQDHPAYSAVSRCRLWGTARKNGVQRHGDGRKYHKLCWAKARRIVHARVAGRSLHVCNLRAVRCELAEAGGLSLVSGLSLSVRSSTRPPRAPGLHPHGEPTPCSSHTAVAAVAGHPPASPAVAGGPRAATATEQTQQGDLAVQVIWGLCWAASRTLRTLDQR